MPSLVLLHQWASRSDTTPPPRLQTKVHMNPTLIVSWWCTIYSLVFILIRVIGRWVRAERLFREDKAMLWSMIPLVARMAFVHVILIWGTNNVETAGLSQDAIAERSIGSRLVLISRILYAMYIWIAKITVLEFVKRTIGTSWTKFNERGVRIIYGFLGLTFVAVVISTLAECQPFSHYWQVVPDPGASCRSGRAQLITMGTCDMVTDVVLMAFPIPVVVMSKMPFKKKVSLCVLFLLSLILIAVTAYRIPATIERHFNQQFRSLLASLEILAATCVANVIAIGSFLRDKGVKKAKFRANSQDDSIAENTLTTTRSKVTSIAQHHWGSDDDLVRDLGLTVRPELRHSVTPAHRLAQPADVSPGDLPQPVEPIIAPQGRGLLDPAWTFRRGSQLPPKQRRASNASSTSSDSSDFKLQVLERPARDDEVPPSPFSPPDSPYKRMDFFDVGGLMDIPRSEQSSMNHNSRRLSHQQIVSIPRSQASFLSDIGGLLGSSNAEKDDIRPAPVSPLRKNSMSLPSQPNARTPSPFVNDSAVRRKSSSQPSQNGATQPKSHGAPGPDAMNMSDAGGLLS